MVDANVELQIAAALVHRAPDWQSSDQYQSEMHGAPQAAARRHLF
jgi:hypothetical protein